VTLIYVFSGLAIASALLCLGVAIYVLVRVSRQLTDARRDAEVRP